MRAPADFSVSVSGVGDRVHLTLLRIFARSGHIRRAAKVLVHVRRANGLATAHFVDAGTLEIDLSNAYWARVAVGWEHEPEVRALIDLALNHHPDLVLLDCGANIGYWGARFAKRCPVIAVEALPTVFRALQRTAEANGFTAIERAIWSESDAELTMTWRAREEASASAVYRHGSRSAVVPTTTVDLLAAEHGKGHPLIVKLDVEGAETEAIDGAPTTRDSALWVYEDHGRDRAHKATKRFLDGGFRVLYLSHGRAPEPISSLDALAAIKTNPSYGYNFAAYQADGPWSGLQPTPHATNGST